jgi:hypothetical protein
MMKVERKVASVDGVFMDLNRKLGIGRGCLENSVFFF